MNRRIKFRGKCPDTGRWIYGLLIHHLGELAIEREYDHLHLYVDPATVGQFTGLNDMNMTEIYEGDVLKHDFKDDTSPNSIVGFDDGIFYTRYADSEYKHILNNHTITTLEYIVIGNIYDNPELLTNPNQ